MNIEFEQKYYVLKIADVALYLNPNQRSAIFLAINEISAARERDNKGQNTYLVLNTDEPYAGQVAKIMQEHGHFTPGGPITVAAVELPLGVAEIIARNLVAWDTSKDKSQGLLPEVYLTNKWLYKELTGEEYEFGKACKKFCIGDGWS